MRLGISEILKSVTAAPDKNTKVKILRENWHPAMKIIFQYAFDPNIKWLLPEGPTPYEPSEAHDAQGILYHLAPKMWKFVEGVDVQLSAADWLTRVNLKPKRREQLWIELLESVDPADARLLNAIKDKKFPYKGITPKLINEAVPGTIP